MTAVQFLLMYLAYSLLIRFFNFATLAEYEKVTIDPLGPPFSLPLLLGGELLVGAFVAALVYVGERSGAVRHVTRALAASYLIVLALDQMAFKFFFSHIDATLYDDAHDLVGLWSSIVDGVDLFLLTDLAVAVAVAVALWRRERPRFVARLAEIIARRPVASAFVGAAYVGLVPLLTRAADQSDLEKTMIGDVLVSLVTGNEEEDESLYPPSEMDDEGVEADSTDDLTEAAQAIRANTKRLNLVYYVIESSPIRETSLIETPPYDTTPFLRELADDGLLFTSYYNVFPGSTRGVFTSLTGMYPYLDAASDIGGYSEIDVPSLPDILHEAGYRTAVFSSSDTFFDSLDAFLGRRSYDHYMDTNLLSEEELRTHASSFWGVAEEVMIDKALEWIAESAGSESPFFLHYIAIYPHHPYKLPARAADIAARDFGDDGQKSRYRASLAYADSAVRRMYEGLERLGVAEKTLFVVTPDHGEAFADLHVRNRLHAERVYEENVHGFLIMQNRAALGPPRRATRLASQVDLLPTILDVLGIESDLPIDGVSLMAPRLKGRVLFFSSRQQHGLRRGNLKAVWRKRRDATELYDLAADPDEQIDIAADYPEEVASMRARHREWREAIKRRYESLVADTGLSEQEVKDLNKKKREEVFGKQVGPLQDVAICPGSGCDGPLAARSEPSVKRGEPVVARLLWKRAGSYKVQVFVFSPDGRVLGVRQRFFRDAQGEARVETGELDLETAGRYKVRILVSEFNVLQDVRTRHFRVVK